MTNYFTANQCEIVEKNNGKLTVQLTDVMDELLMNRPFYWQYVKKLGYPGEPMQVSFITNPERREEKGEWIHFGSPRVHQIFGTLTTKGKFTRLFEHVENIERTPLDPWLVINVKISYMGKHKKDEILSIGLHLINGAMKLDMMDHLRSIKLQNSIADFCYTITPMIKVASGYRRILQHIETKLQNEQHEWAQESWQHLQEEKQLLGHFYTDDEDESAAKLKEQELLDIENRYQPRISIDIINGGVFYFTQKTSQHLLKK